MPQALSWNSLKAVSIWALTRPDHAAVAAGQEQLRLAVLEERVEARAEEETALDPERRDPAGPR